MSVQAGRLTDYERADLIQMAVSAIRNLADRRLPITRGAVEDEIGERFPGEKWWREAILQATARSIIEPGVTGGWVAHRNRVRHTYIASMANDGTNILAKPLRLAMLIGAGTQGVPISGDAIQRKKREINP